MGDPFLNYFALFLLIFVVVVLFYGIIAIHDIPHKIAESRHHPHQDAIYAAGWVSLFTLHALWPFLWIWAMAYRPERGWGFSSNSAAASPPASAGEVEDLRRRITELEQARKPDSRRKRESSKSEGDTPEAGKLENKKETESTTGIGSNKEPGRHNELTSSKRTGGE